MCPRGRPEDNVQTVWNRMVTEFYSDHPNADRFTNIQLSMFFSTTDSGCKGQSKGNRVQFPKMKGKGAEIKALMPALLWCWDQYRRVDDRIHDQIRLVLQCSCFLDDVLDRNFDDDVLPPIDAEQFKQAGFALNLGMTSLLDYYASHRLALFNITPKNHYLAHICLAAAFLNPRRAWCYQGEDLMGHVRRMGSNCARGNSPSDVGMKLMTYYAHALGMSVCKNNRWWER